MHGMDTTASPCPLKPEMQPLSLQNGDATDISEPHKDSTPRVTGTQRDSMTSHPDFHASQDASTIHFCGMMTSLHLSGTRCRTVQSVSAVLFTQRQLLIVLLLLLWNYRYLVSNYRYFP